MAVKTCAGCGYRYGHRLGCPRSVAVVPLHTTAFVERATLRPMESAPTPTAPTSAPVFVAIFEVHGTAPLLGFTWRDTLRVEVEDGKDWQAEGIAWQQFYNTNDLTPGQVFATERITSLSMMRVVKGHEPVAAKHVLDLTIPEGE